jgi:DNA-binding transcriptional regulator YdaS (Cro superfamily)
MKHSEIIDILGGTTKVAQICGISPAAIAQWRTNGVPTDKLMFLAAQLEKQSKGKYTRKGMFPKNWHEIWPELQP